MGLTSRLRDLPLLPLRGVLVFPYMVVHLDVGREKSIRSIDEAMVNDKIIFLSTQKEAQTDDPGVEDIYSTGVVAEIKQVLKMPGGTMRVLVEGLARGHMVEMLATEPFFKVRVEEYAEVEEPKTAEIEALMRTLVGQFEQFVRMSKKVPPETVVSVVAKIGRAHV